MSRENVEYVERIWDRFARTGEADFVDDDVEIHDHDVPDVAVLRGREGFERWVENWAAAWERYTLEPEEFLDAGDRVVVVLRLTAVGRGSGMTLDRQDAMVYEFRDGRIARIDYFNNRAAGLAAAGLPA